MGDQALSFPLQELIERVDAPSVLATSMAGPCTRPEAAGRPSSWPTAGRAGNGQRPLRGRELWYALAAIVAMTAPLRGRLPQAGKFPPASSLVGHGIGIAGFVLMVMTATLYSLRKLATEARWGSMARWLRFHMVTGIVGPYMVLLHTAMRFRGLAGLTMLLTVVVVISGIVGALHLHERASRGRRRRA